MKKTPAPERDPLTRDPRTPDLGSRGARRPERTRAERDLGKGRDSGSRPADKQTKTSRSQRSSSSSDSRSVKTTSRSGGGSRTPQRPRQVKAGGPARMLAPVALVVFAIACFAVIAGSGGSDNAANPAEKSATSSKTDATTATKEPTRSSYKARSGDSFSSIAEKFGITAAELQKLNPDVDPLALQPGQRLKLKE